MQTIFFFIFRFLSNRISSDKIRYRRGIEHAITSHSSGQKKKTRNIYIDCILDIVAPEEFGSGCFQQKQTH